MVDIYHFKSANDTYGRDAGDRVLEAFVSCAQGHLRGADIIGRIGGEEFFLALPETSIFKVKSVAARLGEALRDIRIPYGRSSIGVTCSFGAVQMSVNDHDLIEVIKRADMALYEAKQAGRDRVIAYGADAGTLRQAIAKSVSRLT